MDTQIADMVWIAAGTFMMGSPSFEADRTISETQHQVTISRGFYMGKSAVTVGDFRQFVNAIGYKTEVEASGGGYILTGGRWETRADATWKNPYFAQDDNHPVVLISWNDMVRYCNWKSEWEGLTPAYTGSGADVRCNWNANGYRLPTEAEWEYACRAGTTSPFNTGDTITTEQANYNGNYPYNGNAKGTYREGTTALGSFSANAWGLYDMHGNVWECCWDWFDDYASVPQTDPMGAAPGICYDPLLLCDSYRVERGGSWCVSAQYLRSASRSISDSSGGENNVGFRLVRP
jgi:formylglycine-generating enzyme required for sulfatase activity